MKAVIFDLFETLVTEFDPDYETKPTVASRLGMPKEVYRSEWRALHDVRNTGEMGYEDALKHVCLKLGRPVDEELFRELRLEATAAHDPPFANIEDEVVQALESIRAMGLKTGLISNATAEEIGQWPGCPLSVLMDCTVFSFQVGLVKPDPEIYRLACRRLDVRPEQCVYVGDGGSNELPGAESVGMRPFCATWFIDRFPEKVRVSHDAMWSKDYPRLGSIAELLAIAERMQ